MDVHTVIDIVDLFTPSKQTPGFAKEAVKIGAKTLWLQYGIQHEEAKKISLQNNKLRGIGISTYIEACGGGGPEYATISLGKNGNIEVKIGTQSNGQGHATSYAQIVSDILDIDIEQIEIIQGNSKEIPTGSGTGGSRSMPVGGSALYKATKEFLNKSKDIIASHQSLDTNNLSYEKGFFKYQQKSFSLSDVANIANAARGLVSWAHWEIAAALRSLILFSVAMNKEFSSIKSCAAKRHINKFSFK